MKIYRQSFQIDGKNIDQNSPPYCIAEVGINHNGDLAVAKRMIEVAKESGADAVKFQTFIADEFCGDPDQTFTYKSQGKTFTESMLAMFKRHEFSSSSWRELKRHAELIGITFLSTPQNSGDLKLLLKIGVPAIKVGSDDFTNLPLLRDYVKCQLPLILSCGMSDLAEVHQALEVVGWFNGYPVGLLLCTSQYPTPAEDVNINKLTTLKNAFPGLLLGFSDHTEGSLAAALALSRGAKIFEKHFTLDKNMAGPDHWFSEDPLGLRQWVQTIHMANTLMGSPFMRPTNAELEMRIVARRSIVALQKIKTGEMIDETNIGLRRPGNGLPPEMLPRVLGLKANRDIQRGEKITIGDLLK